MVARDSAVTTARYWLRRMLHGGAGMLRFITLFALAALVAGCAGDNRIDTAAEAATVSAGHGVLVIGLDRSDELDDAGFALEVRAVDSVGRVDTAPLDAASPRRATVMLPRERWLSASPPTSFAFALAPGDYVLTKLYVPVERYIRTDTSSAGQGGSKLDNSAAIGIIGVLALLTVAAIAVAATNDEPATLPPMHYVKQQVAIADAPRFQIRPGEVLYIGHILMGLELREQQVEDPWGGRGPNALDQSATTTIVDKRVFAEHAFDLPGTRANVAGLGLGRRPFRTQQIRLSDQPRTMLYSYPAPDPKLPVRIARARPDLPLADAAPARATGPARPTPSPAPTTAPGASRDLMERFLSGAITREQYDAERARPAPGS